MMPGETHSAAPGAAADLSRCQGCASLQQNLNEYVEALITLKQKIINTDNLLTEYQKKCDELQFARRENSTLHHQVEQMLQKISPLQKCQEELGSLKAELEEKKSSLKLYQDTHQEYARVKEECLKTDAQKKKLEAKVKKLEEAAVKQTQDFKQLRNEKKILEKEFKKTQERLDEFSKQKNEKELRHIGTQISSDSYGSIDKRKVKLLLKELWFCINTAHRVPGERSRCVPANSAQEQPRARESREDGAPTQVEGSPPRASAAQACLTELSVEIEGGFSACESTGRERPGTAAHHSEDQPPEALMQRNDEEGANLLDHDQFFDEDLQAAVDFFKLPPPLLSPVPSPPLGSLPHQGNLPSLLAPETYFGEYTDSSDNDSAQHRNSTESVSEDDTTEAQDCFDLSRKNKGSGTWEENPKTHEDTQALKTLEGSEVTTVGCGTFTATLREPSASFSLAPEKHWTVSSQFMRGTKRSILGEAKRQREVRELDDSLHTEEETPHKPTGRMNVEQLSGSLARGKELALGKIDICYSPLGKRPLNELMISEGRSPLSRMIGSPKSDFTKWTTNEITCESDCVSVSDHLQGLSRKMGKEKEDIQGFVLRESPEPEEDAGDVMDAAELDAEADFSSTSGALSVYSNTQSSSGLKCGHDTHVSKVISPEICHSEQKLQARTSNMSGLQSEPPKCSVGADDLENSLRALNPELGASDFYGQSNSAVDCIKAVKGMMKLCGLPQSLFMKAMKDGQCESQCPGVEHTPGQSDFTALGESQSGLIKSGFGFVKSTSWHHSDLLRRGGETTLRAALEQEQETNPQLQKAVPSLENRGSASLLPNQVSVITKQARPEMCKSARTEPFRPRRNEPASATENVDMSSRARCGEREKTTQSIKEVAATKRTSPDVSTSWRKLDFNSPSDSLPVEKSDRSTNSKLSFFSENIPVPKQNTMEPTVQVELQEQRPCPNATELNSSGVSANKFPPATEMAVSGSFPVEEMSCEDTGRSDSEALAISKDSPSVEQSPEKPLEQPSPTSVGASSEGPGTTGTAFLPAVDKKDEETHILPQSSLPGPLYCYTGIREGGGDTEVEESEAPSCSEGENEPEAVMGNQQQDAVKASKRDVGATDADATETRPFAEVGCLASALQDFNISTLSEIDRLSTSEVVMFLESCQLRDYSSGDSVSEFSSKETLNKAMNRELKQSEISEEKYTKELCEEETLKTCEEWIESEEDDCPLRDASQLTQCSLETLSEVLTKIGQELQSNYEDSDGKDASNLLLFSIQDSLTAKQAEEQVSPQQTSCSPLHPSDPLPSTASMEAKGSSPTSGASTTENTQDRPKGNSGVTRLIDSGDEVLSELAEPPPQCSDSEAGQIANHSSGCEAGRTFQCQISTVTSEVINVLIKKDQNLIIEKGDNWTIINGVALMPDMEQVTLCDNPASPGGGGPGAGFVSVTSVDKSPETSHPGSPFQEPSCGSNLPGSPEDISSSGQSSNFDKSRLRNRPVKPSVRISSEIYDQIFESQIVASDHTYYNSKLEPFGKNKNRSKISNKDLSCKPIKTSAPGRLETNQGEVSQSSPGDRGNTKTQRPQTQTILANADTSTPTDCSADTLSKIRQEVGPPLPPLLAPLIATPPRTSHPVSPLISSSSPSSPTSPVEQLSPLSEIPVPPTVSPLLEDPGRASPSCTSLSPSVVPAGERMLSSPLQFCATTPKHALPVPGRLPACASAHTAVAGPQENSVKILDTMYPELSARARTLNILKGNIQLTRGPPADRQNLPGPVSTITGFKAITSMSTAFVKTGGSSAGDCNQDKLRDLGTSQDSSGKRTLTACTPRSAKRLRLDSGSPEPETESATSEGDDKQPHRDLPQAEVTVTDEEPGSVPAASTDSQLPLNPKETVESHDKAIGDALKKISESSFDLLPVIRSHVYVGNISQKPVMRDQEKEVVSDFSTTKKHLAECLLHSILSELKLQKTSLEHNYIHALCRVYVGICRQLGDMERARLFCYSLLKEDFPESEKLTLFIANMWHDIFLSQSVISKAMQLVARQRAKGEVLNCLRAFLNWEKNAPADVGFMVSKLLLTIQLCPKTEFQPSEKFGEDLSDNIWEYIFAIDLLCCHQKWIWTHDNIISKELWPVMDKWIKYRKGHANIAYIPDVIIASILRLIGRLGQLGLKEGYPSAVKNISSIIGMFIQHAQDEDIPWGIQLAAVYALCDLSPSNPAEISKILEAWRRETSHSVPSAVVSSLEEVGALCTEDLG